MDFGEGVRRRQHREAQEQRLLAGRVTMSTQGLLHRTCPLESIAKPRQAWLRAVYPNLFRREKSENMEGKKGGHVKSGTPRGKIGNGDQNLGYLPPK